MASSSCSLACLTTPAACVAALYLLCKLNPLVRFYVKSAAMYLFILLNACVSVPYGMLHPWQFR